MPGVQLHYILTYCCLCYKHVFYFLYPVELFGDVEIYTTVANLNFVLPRTFLIAQHRIFRSFYFLTYSL